MITATGIETAADRLAPHVVRTPSFVSEPLSARLGAMIVIKAEHRQRTGSFKLRGALNRILALTDDERRRGVVTASSGNHGIACATAAAIAGTSCVVYLPTGASPAKVAAITRAGAEIVTVDDRDAQEAERQARATADSSGRCYVSPYNDPLVIAGQGTVGLELLADSPRRPDAIVVAVGGGGLISGVGTWARAVAPSVEIIGASPAADRALPASIEAGRIVDPPAGPTFSDGTAGGLDPDAITFELCRSLVDRWIAVPEPAIARAVAAMIDDHHELVEGAAGVALAAAGELAAQRPSSTIAIVTCGANVSSATLAAMLAVAAERAE